MLTHLKNKILEHFNLDELDDLCLELSINRQSIPGDTIDRRSRELVEFCKRRGELTQLIEKCAELRPLVDWSEFTSKNLSSLSDKNSTQDNSKEPPFQEVDNTKKQVNPINSVSTTTTSDSSAFFYKRFSSAFPGVRGAQLFKNPIESVERLQIFFKEPFTFDLSHPLWWWRTGCMPIKYFEVLAPNTILIDIYEIVIEELVAVNPRSYYQSFIYIKAKASQPTGIYNDSLIQEQLDLQGYATEEFALFQGRPISRAEFDDGAAVIDGKVVDIGYEAELRVRYLTPYNLILAPQGSPLNNINFDNRRAELLNAILNNQATLDSLTNEILQLPRKW